MNDKDLSQLFKQLKTFIKEREKEQTYIIQTKRIKSSRTNKCAKKKL